MLACPYIKSSNYSNIVGFAEVASTIIEIVVYSKLLGEEPIAVETNQDMVPNKTSMGKSS